jgi:hypothetical protein
MSKPITDAHMSYDYTAHRYKLTELYVLQMLNRNLADVLADNGAASDVAKEPSILLDRISKQIYGYCMRCTATPYLRERRMALDILLRPHIAEAMAEQLIYVLNNGDLSAYTGINIDTGMAIDRDRMRQAEIAPLALDVLTRCGLASVAINPWERDITPNYKEEGY